MLEDMPPVDSISIHSLNEEGDRAFVAAEHIANRFQSTHSMKSETNTKIENWLNAEISIHSLNEEGDGPHRPDAYSIKYFNPLTQGRVRHGYVMNPKTTGKISIHSLNEEGDSGYTTLKAPSSRDTTKNFLFTKIVKHIFI